MQLACFEVDIRPAQPEQLGRPQSVNAATFTNVHSFGFGAVTAIKRFTFATDFELAFVAFAALDPHIIGKMGTVHNSQHRL
jgi:hypothetical protein